MARKKTARRRGNKEGSVYQKKDGSWVAQVTIGRDDNGKLIRKAFSGRTREDVVAKMAPYLGNSGVKEKVLKEDVKLDKHMLFWMMKYKRRTVASRTFEKCLQHAKSYIFPTIGTYATQNISTNQVQSLLGEMLDKGFSLDTVKKVKYLLSQYFEYCIDENIVDKNPVFKVKVQANSVKKSSAEAQEYKAIPEHLRDKFLVAISSSALFKPLCLTSMFAGLRIGEVLGLKWKDYDPKSKTLTVRRAQTVDVDFDGDGNVIRRNTVIGKTKTAGSVRILPIPDILVTALNEWKKIRSVQEALIGNHLSDADDFVFGTNEGHIRTYYGTRHMFMRLLKKHGLENEGIHFYKLRHTFSNTLFEAQTNPKIVQMLMGHKKVETTMIYNTATDNKYLKKAVDVFDARYAGDLGESELEKEAGTIPIGDKNAGASEIGEEMEDKLASFMSEYSIDSVDDLVELLSDVKEKKNQSQM